MPADAADAAVALQSETDLVAAIVAGVDADHRWVAALISRAFRDAVRSTHLARPRWCATTPDGALTSLARYELALECGCPWRRELFAMPLKITVHHPRCASVFDPILDRMVALCAQAARSGDVALLARLRADGCVWGASTCSAAAKAGHLEVIQWARANGCYWNDETTRLAARSGHLGVLQWARDHGCPVDRRTCAAAAGNGRLEVLQWLVAVGCVADEETCLVAAANGHLEVLQWTHAHGCPWDCHVTEEAMVGGHLALLKWARANDCPWNPAAHLKVANWQHAEVVRWAVENGCPVDYHALACREAARWLLENGHVDADAAACYMAANVGDLPLLQWIRDRGCPWDPGVLYSAALGGRLDVLQWARAEGCDWPGALHVQLGETEMIQWLVRESDCPPASLLISTSDTKIVCPETLQLLRNARIQVK
jgi:hypothetical protein